MGKNFKYDEHFKAFADCTAYAARAYAYHLALNSVTSKTVLDALNNNARFWLDFRHTQLVATVIFLGQVFDRNEKAHSINSLLVSLKENLNNFSKEELKIRKAIDAVFEDIDMDSYIDNAHELSTADIEVIELKVEEATKIWSVVKPLRDKVMAHREALTAEHRESLYEQIKYEDFESLLVLLLNIRHALEQAELNGKKPDFSTNRTYYLDSAKRDAQNVLKQLESARERGAA